MLKRTCGNSATAIRGRDSLKGLVNEEAVGGCGDNNLTWTGGGRDAGTLGSAACVQSRSLTHYPSGVLLKGASASEWRVQSYLPL